MSDIKKNYVCIKWYTNRWCSVHPGKLTLSDAYKLTNHHKDCKVVHSAFMEDYPSPDYFDDMVIYRYINQHRETIRKEIVKEMMTMFKYRHNFTSQDLKKKAFNEIYVKVVKMYINKSGLNVTPEQIAIIDAESIRINL